MFNIGKKKIEIIVREAKPCINIITKEKNRSICIMKCVITEKGMLIGDIIDLKYPKHIDKGYGTKMMITLLQFCSKNNINYLYGNLSTVDEEHKDRLMHFYEKFGFNIILYDITINNEFGKIEMYKENFETYKTRG